MDAKRVPQPRARKRPTRRFAHYPAVDRRVEAKVPAAVLKVDALIRPFEDGQAPIYLINSTSRPVRFLCTGVLPECSIEVNGNTTYGVNLLISPDSSKVQVFRGDRLGEVLAEREMESGSGD